MKKNSLLLLVFSTISLLSCSITDSQTESDVNHSFLDIHFQHRVETKQVKEFRNKSSWESFWEEANEWHSDNIIDLLPEVDFQREWVVGVFWGEASGCGSQANFGIKSVKARNTTALIDAVNMPYMGACRAIVYPRSFITLPRTMQSAQVNWE